MAAYPAGLWMTVMSISANALCTAGSAGVELTIAERGQSAYRIMVAADAILSERYAAEELQRYIERTSGVRLPIVTDKDARTPHDIVLGDNAALGRARDAIDFAKLGSDGFVLRTDGTRLLIVGGKPRGTLYGVYGFLEEKLGVRWFTPEVESVPKVNRLVLPAMDETHVPLLEYREVFWTEMMRDADFAARHRLNGNHYPLTEKHGGRFVVYFPFVHSFDMLVPPELYSTHPEYFPFIDGKRTSGLIKEGQTSGYVQRCLSNPDVLRIATDRVRQWIREHPEATVISVSQNDTDNHCECEPCKSLDDAEGSPAASLIRFVNAIAEAIERNHPNVRIDTLAYQYSRKAPKTLRPRRNVIVRLCSIECCFAHPLDQCPAPENQQFAQDIRAWQQVAPLLYVWDYTTNFAHYQQPFPNFDALQANVQYFVRHGVKGLFEQGNSSGGKHGHAAGGNGELGPLRAYILAKLLWNPDTDVKRHTDEFLRGYYGNAADPIREHIELIHRSVREHDQHVHITDPSTAPYLNDELLTTAERLFEQAERLADTDDIRFRVQAARLPIWYVKLATKRASADTRAELLTRFLSIARQAGISNISEAKSLDDWAKENGAK
jgi:hypothetical protein